MSLTDFVLRRRGRGVGGRRRRSGASAFGRHCRRARRRGRSRRGRIAVGGMRGFTSEPGVAAGLSPRRRPKLRCGLTALATGVALVLDLVRLEFWRLDWVAQIGGRRPRRPGPYAGSFSWRANSSGSGAGRLMSAGGRGPVPHMRGSSPASGGPRRVAPTDRRWTRKRCRMRPVCGINRSGALRRPRRATTTSAS